MRLVRRAVVLAVAGMLAGCGGSSGTPVREASTAPSVGATASPSLPAGVETFAADELAAQQRADGRAYSSFARSGSLEAGLYLLQTGAEDRQTPHARDEIYVVLDGTATLTVGDSRVDMAAGSAIFVRAGTDHHLEAVDGDVSVVVVFVDGASDEDPPFEVVASPDEPMTDSATRWHQTLSRKTVNAGLYWLPVTGGGDSPITHKVDEINVVLRGRGAFDVEGSSIDLATHDVVLVPAGLAHTFDTPVADLLDLIVFAGH